MPWPGHLRTAVRAGRLCGAVLQRALLLHARRRLSQERKSRGKFCPAATRNSLITSKVGAALTNNQHTVTSELARLTRATAEDRRYCANLTYPNADDHISLSDSRSVAVERLAQLVGSGLGRRVRIALVAGIRGAAQAVHPPAPNLDGHPPPPVSPKRHC